MIELLGNLRREMNGAVADSMYYGGKRYGLNYGVSIPTIRSIAATEEQNMALAEYLIAQQVRELQLASFHIAPTEELTAEGATYWESYIYNSELAEEAAFALFGKCRVINELCERWFASNNEYLCYCGLLAAAHNPAADLEAVVAQLCELVARNDSSRYIAQGAIALLASLIHTAERHLVTTALEQMPETPTAQKIREEIEWQLKY